MRFIHRLPWRLLPVRPSREGGGMTSPALEAWRSSRLPRLDRLLAAHPNSAGSSTDPAVSDEWSQALVLRLASEFQGFCRDLHDDAVQAIVTAVTPPVSPLRVMLLEGLTVGRGLDRFSADPRTIKDDFRRLGLDLWVLVGTGRAESTSVWREGLRLLHRARSGVVHDDAEAIEAVRGEGWPIQLDTVWRWRNLLDEMATAMDHGLGEDIAEQIRRSR